MTAALGRLPDLAARGLGGSVVCANDDFFASVHNLLSPGAALHDPAAFDVLGKVYDGWETRRRRETGADFAIVRLGAAGIVHGVVIDTAHFTGNYPPFASVHGTTRLGYPSADELRDGRWFPLAEDIALQGDTANVVPVGHAASGRLVTHVRLTIWPDGGVARLRVHGEVVPDPRALGGRVDLAAAAHGGRISACSDEFYSSPANVLAPGRARVMSDGWETARRRDDGNDWLIVRLAAPGALHHAVLDTGRFVGNSPAAARLSDAESGIELLARTRVQPDTEHRFRLASEHVVSSVRLDIYPDGGLSRLRLNGAVAPAYRDGVVRRWLALLGPDAAAGAEPAEFFE